MAINIIYLLIFCIFIFLSYLIIMSVKRGVDVKNKDKK